MQINHVSVLKKRRKRRFVGKRKGLSIYVKYCDSRFEKLYFTSGHLLSNRYRFTFHAFYYTFSILLQMITPRMHRADFSNDAALYPVGEQIEY